MIYKKDNIDMSLVQCPYEEEDKYIYIEDDYTNNILKLSGYSDINEYDFYVLCNGRIFETATYEYALKSVKNAYNYAAYMLEGVFEEGESLIASNVLCAYEYARYVLRGRFELSEKVIATDAEYSYRYARHALNGRFELGEPVIATNAHYSYNYAKYALKGRFELGEPVIATNAKLSYLYARDVLNGRFELGEQTIAADPFYNPEYKQFIGIAI